MSVATEGTYLRAVSDMGRLRALWYLVRPNKNTYEPIFDTKVIGAGSRLSGEAVCVPKHRGPFEVGVVCGNPIGNPMEHVGRVRVKIVLSPESGGEGRELTREFSIGNSVWWNGHMRNGFSLVYYGVPLDVKLMAPMRCSVTVDDLDGALSKYQPVSFYSRFAWVS
jgi:hypothetical protein